MSLAERISLSWQYRHAGLLALSAPLLRAAQRAGYRRRLAHIELPRNPLLIIGYWRTGTTLMHELLALDPRHRAPTSYESFYAPHFLLSEGWFKPRLAPLLPKTRPQDAMGLDFDLPQEDEFALLSLGARTYYEVWQSQAGPVPVERGLELLEFERLTPQERQRWVEQWTYFLRCLLLRRPGLLLLKSPPHSWRLPLLEQLFPEARYVYLVRDPRSLLASAIHTQRALLKEPAVFDRQMEFAYSQEAQLIAHMHGRVEADRQGIPASRFVTVRYEDLAADPTATVKGLYERLSLGGYAEVEPLLAASVRGRAGYPRNRLEITEAQMSPVRHHLVPYAERHGYSLEASRDSWAF